MIMNGLWRFRALIEASKQDLISLGFPQFTIEDFHDVVSLPPHISLRHNNHNNNNNNGLT